MVVHLNSGASGRYFCFFVCFLTSTILSSSNKLETILSGFHNDLPLEIRLKIMSVVPASKKRKRSSSSSRGGSSSGDNGRRSGAGPPGPNVGRGGFTRDPGYVDLGIANYNIDTVGTITLLNIVPQGPATSQRIGKKIMLKSLQAHGYMYNNTQADTNIVSYLVVYDRRPCGNLPAVTDVLKTANALSFNNDNNSGRFRILKRVNRVLIGRGPSDHTSLSSHEESFFISLKGLGMVFNSVGTGEIGDIDEGAIYFITVGGMASGTTAASATMAFRTRYLDI